MKPTVFSEPVSDGTLSDCARPCHPGDRAALALSEPNWVGTPARRHRDQAGQRYILFPAGDVFALEPAVQSHPLGREPLKRASKTAQYPDQASEIVHSPGLRQRLRATGLIALRIETLGPLQSGLECCLCILPGPFH
jgi:hypothetical protein